MNDTALIFGASGQDAFYLRGLLEKENVQVIGISRSAGGNWQVGNVSDREQVDALVRTHRPTYIFHLAANSTVRHDALFENHETITSGTLNVLDAVYNLAPKARVFLSGSGLQFENHGSPISETDPFEANSPYSMSRIQSVYAARYYRRLGVRVYVGYLFHHESPLRKAHHVSQKIAQAVRRIAAGSTETLVIGDVSVCKEWAFAGDIAAGIMTLVTQENVMEACLGTGKAYSIAEWLQACFQVAGLDWREHVCIRDDFQPEYSCLVSDPAILFSFGWQPSVDFPSLAKMMVSSP